MDKEKSIEMIDEYLLEPNNINKEWVECLQMCRQALSENEQLKAEIDGQDVEIMRLKHEIERLKPFEKKVLKQMSDNLVKEMVGDKE